MAKTSPNALLKFLDASPTPFHAVENVAARLAQVGYQAVAEGAHWEAKAGKYYFIRNDSSLVALELKRPPVESGFRIIGAHTDSPCLKVKPNAITCNNGYAKLAVEVYGGALLAPWFDRGLGLAGRVTMSSQDKQQNHLINFNKAIAFIPSLAIHLDRKVNQKRSINPQKELPAVLCRVDDEETEPNFHAVLQAQLKRQYPKLAKKLDGEKVLAFELCLYDCQVAETVGLKNEFIASGRLDNLLSCYVGMEALAMSESETNKVLVLNDHEEVGSVSASGADGTFLHSVLLRACAGNVELARALSHSMLLSVDNAHGVHPNYADKHEPSHQPLINAGTVIKINSNQRYATNSETSALFQRVCERNHLPFQTIVVRSDMGCGSTIGPITASKLGIRTADIGVAQLAMHSARELAGSEDSHTLQVALQGFFALAELDF